MADPCKTTSPANPPSSAGANSLVRLKETLFRTITSDDWKHSLASARRQPNAVSAQIRTAISSSSRKTKPWLIADLHARNFVRGTDNRLRVIDLVAAPWPADATRHHPLIADWLTRVQHDPTASTLAAVDDSEL